MEAVSLETQSRAGSSAPDCSVGVILRFIGVEPAGSILMALGQRPLRTKQLTGQIRSFSARSVYRCIGKLEALGLVGRLPETGASSRVPLQLTEPAGRNLFRLLRSFTYESAAGYRSPAGLPGNGNGGLSWYSLCLLGELWERGFAKELGHGSRSLVDLLERTEGLTYHQVRRKAAQFVDDGILEARPHNGQGRLYQLTALGRRRMIAIAALGRWRHRHLLADGTPGLELEELALVLRIIVPLVMLPEHGGSKIDFVITGAEDKYGHRDAAELRGVVGQEGTLKLNGDAGEDADGSAAATTNTWFAALLDGNRGRIRVRGDLNLVDSCLTRLYDELWIPLKR
jgi:DNA-binding HxlR family transcriptional regulator